MFIVSNVPNLMHRDLALDFKDMDENSFDVIIFGTGLVESIVAACVLNWLHNW